MITRHTFIPYKTWVFGYDPYAMTGILIVKGMVFECHGITAEAAYNMALRMYQNTTK